MNITITAGNGQGKTAVAYALFQLLTAAGAEVVLEDEIEEIPLQMIRDWPKRIKSLNGKKITINTKHPALINP